MKFHGVRIGDAPYLECSSKGDKRFSAFHARVKMFNNRTIEEIYQASKILEDGSTGHHWREVKGRLAVNQDFCIALYKFLWLVYILENMELLPVLRAAPGLSDMFGKLGHCCQAFELWEIRNSQL